ncbi:MAG: hypothetical protein KKE17_15430 [Proteobacteria bacterium]|nr:hypothetical protein [Pseudomonadota bacterium]MBU1711391.1 hypothetical protein [Pseudomonadota bacterium]
MGLKNDMKSLRELQAIDLQISKIDEDLALGEEELEKRKLTIAERQESIVKYDEKKGAGERRRRELEAEVEDELARIKDRQTKLMNVQTNREYQSLLKEIEDAKKNNKQREDEIVLLMEQVETLKNKEHEQSTICATEETLLSEENEKVGKNATTLNKKKEDLLKTRETKSKKVPAASLKKYEMLREKRNGIAIVGVTNSICTGCYMNVPAQFYNEVLKEEKILSCPTCNRMLYYQPEE